MTTFTYGRYRVEVSNPGKLLFAADGISKTDIVDYYQCVAERLLPALRERPLVLQRFPDGIADEGFYQKQVGSYFPDWIETAKVRVKTDDSDQHLAVCNKRATLTYLAGQACITLHPWLSRRDRLQRPDQMIFDLDPAGEPFAPVRTTAFRLRELLNELGLCAYVKTTGSSGAHVVVPLQRGAGFDAVRDFARTLADLLARRYPKELTTEIRKARRGGRLYLDVARNGYAQTAVAPYALRARRGAPVAMPVHWEELADRDLTSRSFNLHAAMQRATSGTPDPWAGMSRHGRSLSEPRRRLSALCAE